MIRTGRPPAHRPPRSEQDRAAVVAVAAIVATNLAMNRWRSPGAYLSWSVGLTAGLVALARRAGHSMEQLGLDPRHLRRSLRVGGAGAGMVAAGYAVVAGTGLGSGLLADRRVTGLDGRAARWHALVVIPWGTVVGEEVAFRGVLPALLGSPRRQPWTTQALSSVLFGMWHLLPARHGSHINQRGRRRSPARAVVIEVGATTIAGVVLGELRRRTGHIAAPSLVHLATNILGFVTARTMGAA